MPLKGFQYGEQRLTFEEAERKAETAEFPYPVPLIRAMRKEREDDVPTASVLAGCLRRFELKRHQDFYVKPFTMLPSLFGTGFHGLMDENTPTGEGIHVEMKLLARMHLGLGGEFEDVPVGGRVDYFKEGALVRDWKTTGYIAKDFKPYPEAKAQVNVYNWLAAQAGYEPAPDWEIVYVSRSWVSRFSDSMQPLAVTEGWIRKRLLRWASAVSQGRLPEPVPEVLDADAKTGKPVGQCGYCEVREHCLAALKLETARPF